jgi:hypothetical protein
MKPSSYVTPDWPVRYSDSVAVTDQDFRRIALSLPEAEERLHMAHPDFRVGGKIFATLNYPSAGWGMVKLTPEQQREFVIAESAAFTPIKNAWGLKGATNVKLKAVSETELRRALLMAWRGTAPKRLK